MKTKEHLGPEVTRLGILNMQVCVPKSWTYKRVQDFANRENEAGTSMGWIVHKTKKDPIRVPCEVRIGFVHIVLEC